MPEIAQLDQNIWSKENDIQGTFCIEDKKKRNKTLGLGLGNPMMKDDKAGFLVSRMVETFLGERKDIEVSEFPLAGSTLLDLITGYPRVIIIDAIQTTRGEPGTIYRLLPEDLVTSELVNVNNETNLSFVLGDFMDMEMPTEIIVFAIEVEDAKSFGENCTMSVAAAITKAAAQVLREVLDR